MKQVVISSLALSLLGACASTPQQPAAPKPFELTIAHINDHHSHLAPSELTFDWAGQAWQVEAGGFPRMTAMIDQIRQNNQNVLTLHAGDAITGSVFFKRLGSAADARFMNDTCFDAFTIGNHEFDTGDAGLKTFLDQLGTTRCNTVKLSANIEPEIGVSPLTPQTATDSFQPYTIIQRDGQSLGLVGLTIAQRTMQTSHPDKTTRLTDELAAAQRSVAELQAQGIEKIILLTHVQYQNDIDFAGKLPGVDVIIGGDSHTLLGDFSAFGIDADGAYPTQVTNAEGDPVCIAHAYKYSQVVGELHVTFDGDRVASCSGRPHYLIGSDVQPKAGAVTTVQPVLDALDQSGVFTRIEPDTQQQAWLDTYQQQIDAFANEVLAKVPQRICTQPIGTPRRAECGQQQSSGLQRLIAESFLAAAPDADFAIQNGDGSRGDIEPGTFTVGDAYKLLPYGNTLMTIEISGSELKQVLEEALNFAVTGDDNIGAYPYGANIQYSINLQQGFGDRISDIKVWDDEQQTWKAVRPRDTYRVVTNSYIAGGQSGYKTFLTLSDRGRAHNTGIDYAQAFADYVRQFDQLKRPTQFATQEFVPVKE